LEDSQGALKASEHPFKSFKLLKTFKSFKKNLGKTIWDGDFPLLQRFELLERLEHFEQSISM